MDHAGCLFFEVLLLIHFNIIGPGSVDFFRFSLLSLSASQRFAGGSVIQVAFLVLCSHDLAESLVRTFLFFFPESFSYCDGRGSKYQHPRWCRRSFCSLPHFLLPAMVVSPLSFDLTPPLHFLRRQ